MPEDLLDRPREAVPVDDLADGRMAPVGRPSIAAMRAVTGRVNGWMIFVVVMYLGLLLMCVSIMVLVVVTRGADFSPVEAPSNQLFSLAADTFRILLGALLGALTVIAERALPTGR